MLFTILLTAMTLLERRNIGLIGAFVESMADANVQSVFDANTVVNASNCR